MAIGQTSAGRARLYGRAVYEYAKNFIKQHIPALKRDGSGELTKPLDRKVWPSFYIHPENVTMDPNFTLSKLDPAAFHMIGCSIAVLAPHLFFAHALGNIKRNGQRDGKPPCPLCKRSTNVKCKGWTTALRHVAALGYTHYIYSYRYYCQDCPGG
jgi:hypothetical protein